MTEKTREELEHELFHRQRMEEERVRADGRYAMKWTEKALIGGAVLIGSALLAALMRVVLK